MQAGEKMNLKKDYKQYFTPDRLAEYMVNLIPDDSIRSVVDLSMGECGLLEEAKKDGKMLFYMVQI
jgi:Type I restriction-modification system methyltransferase subunit